MNMTIDRHLCDHVLSECEQCFGRLMRNPLGEERPCIVEFGDDGDPILNLTLRYDQIVEQLSLPPADRERVAVEGWSEFVTVTPKFYRE
ncbi:MAG: hypothetical protein HY260_21145 [Chloroflexi bacterium]|nr:hypothetical protein [Chloroflexota bacterium]